MVPEVLLVSKESDTKFYPKPIESSLLTHPV
jgi:hypothetical protein